MPEILTVARRTRELATTTPTMPISATTPAEIELNQSVHWIVMSLRKQLGLVGRYVTASSIAPGCDTNHNDFDVLSIS